MKSLADVLLALYCRASAWWRAANQSLALRRRPMANGDGERRRRTANGDGERRRRTATATANGDGERRRRTATATPTTNDKGNGHGLPYMNTISGRNLNGNGYEPAKVGTLGGMLN